MYVFISLGYILWNGIAEYLCVTFYRTAKAIFQSSPTILQSESVIITIPILQTRNLKHRKV